MAIDAREVLDLVLILMFVAYICHAKFHTPSHHTTQADTPKAEVSEAQVSEAEVSEAKVPKIETPQTETPEFVCKLEALNTEDTVAKLVEKAMRPVVQWHDTQKRADGQKIKVLEASQHAIMTRQKIFEQVTEKHLSQIQNAQNALEARLAHAEETARAATTKLLTAQHQREVESLRRKLKSEQKDRQKAEKRHRDLERELTKVTTDAEGPRAKTENENEQRIATENKSQAAASKMARLFAKFESLRSELTHERRRRSRAERALAAAPKPVSERSPPVDSGVSRQAVATFKLHAAEPDKPSLPKALSVDELADLLSAFHLNERQDESAVIQQSTPKQQQLVLYQQPLGTQQAAHNQHVVTSQQPIVSRQLPMSQQLVLYQQPIVTQQPIVSHNVILTQLSVAYRQPVNDQQTDATQNNVNSQDFIVKEEPAISNEPVEQETAAIQQLVVVEKPVILQEPVLVQEPDVGQEDVVQQEPVVVPEAVVEPEPIAEQELVVGNESVDVKEIVADGQPITFEHSDHQPGPSLSHGHDAEKKSLAAPVEPEVVVAQEIATDPEAIIDPVATNEPETIADPDLVGDEEPVGANVPVAEEQSFISQHCGQQHCTSLSHGHDTAQGSLHAPVEPVLAATARPESQKPFTFDFNAPLPGSWMAQASRVAAPQPHISLADVLASVVPKGDRELDTEMSTALDESSLIDQVPEAAFVVDGKNDVEMPPAPEDSSVLDQAREASDGIDERDDLDIDMTPVPGDSSSVVPAFDAPVEDQAIDDVDMAFESSEMDSIFMDYEGESLEYDCQDQAEFPCVPDPTTTTEEVCTVAEEQPQEQTALDGQSQAEVPSAPELTTTTEEVSTVAEEQPQEPTTPATVEQQPTAETNQVEVFDKWNVLSVPHVPEPREEESQGSNSSDTTNASSSGSGSTSHAGHYREPAPAVVFGARPVIQAKRNKQKLTQEQIAQLLPPTTNPLKPTNTLYSSNYLAQLRLHMADLEILKKMIWDAYEDDPWIMELKRKNDIMSEDAFCKMTEETYHAVPPFTANMLSQMMEAFFETIVWKLAKNDYVLEASDKPGHWRDYMGQVEKYMDTHPADALPVSCGP